MITTNSHTNRDFSSDDWDRIHQEIQKILAPLGEQAQTWVPAIRSKSGKTVGKTFPLFSHRVFFPPEGSSADPVVVGVDFQANANEVVIRGDISGEETGRIFFEIGLQTVPKQYDQVQEAAQRIAAELAAQGHLLPQALVGNISPAPV